MRASLRSLAPTGGLGGFPRSIYLLGVSNFVLSAGRSAAWLFLPILLYTGYGLSFFEIGVLIALMIPVSMVSSLVGGAGSDRYGRRPFVALPPLLNSATGFLIYGFWNHGLLLLMGLLALNSLFINLGNPSQNAVIADVVASPRRLDAFSLFRIFSNAGFALSPALGGFLASAFGLPVVFLVSSVTNLIGGILLIFLFPETKVPGGAQEPTTFAKGMSFPFHDASLLAFGVLGFGLTLAVQQFGTALALFTSSVRGLTYDQIGWLYSVNGLLVVLLQLPIARQITLRKRYLRWMATGSILYGLSFLIFYAAPIYLVFVIGMGILTIGEDIVSPLQNVVVAAMASSEKRGSYFGAYSTLTSSARVIAPPLGTLLLSTGSSLALWGTMALVTVVVAAGYLFLHQRLGHRFLSDS